MRPKIIGILNMTADSFSDGGQFLSKDKALAHAKTLAQGGSDIIDIGAASSHPDSAPVSPETEIERLARVLPALKASGLELSIDTYQPKTQIWALAQKAQNVAWLNDIQGFCDPRVREALVDSDCKLFVMHSIQAAGAAKREATPKGDILDIIEYFFDARLACFDKLGIARERLVLDPGMGFFLGDDPAPSLRVLAHIQRLKKTFGLPVLISVSRKSFLRSLSGRTIFESAPVTLVAELWAAAQGVDYIRTHDSKQLRDGLDLQMHLQDYSA